MDCSEVSRKRLLYTSQHRGMREMDLILGQFAREHVPSMREEDLQVFEQILAFSDQKLYEWFFGDAPLPEPPLRAMLENVISGQLSVIRCIKTPH